MAEYLTEKGFDAASLKGGYISWLLDAMKEDEVAERDIKQMWSKASERNLRNPSGASLQRR